MMVFDDFFSTGVPDLWTERAEKPIPSASDPSTWRGRLWTGEAAAGAARSGGARLDLRFSEPAGHARPGAAQGVGADEQAEMVARAGHALDILRPGANQVAHRHQLRQRHHLVLACRDQ